MTFIVGFVGNKPGPGPYTCSVTFVRSTDASWFIMGLLGTALSC